MRGDKHALRRPQRVCADPDPKGHEIIDCQRVETMSKSRNNVEVSKIRTLPLPLQEVDRARRPHPRDPLLGTARGGESDPALAVGEAGEAASGGPGRRVGHRSPKRRCEQRDSDRGEEPVRAQRGEVKLEQDTKLGYGRRAKKNPAEEGASLRRMRRLCEQAGLKGTPEGGRRSEVRLGAC